MKDILLTDEVIEELDEIVKLHKQKGPDDKELEDKCSEFFHTYGTHAKGGPFTFGGIFIMNTHMNYTKTEHRDEVKTAVAKKMTGTLALSGSYGGGSGKAQVSGSKNDEESHDNKNMSSNMAQNVMLNIEKHGGPSETNDIPKWNRGLMKYNETWKVIDHGNKAIPIWKIIHRHHRNHFVGNADTLIQLL